MCNHENVVQGKERICADCCTPVGGEKDKEYREMWKAIWESFVSRGAPPPWEHKWDNLASLTDSKEQASANSWEGFGKNLGGRTDEPGGSDEKVPREKLHAEVEAQKKAYDGVCAGATAELMGKSSAERELEAQKRLYEAVRYGATGISEPEAAKLAEKAKDLRDLEEGWGKFSLELDAAELPEEPDKDEKQSWKTAPASVIVTRDERDPNGVMQHEPGAKLDDGKVLAGILSDFSLALLAVAEVGTHGAAKYTRGGWQSVQGGETRYFDAEWRHLLKSRHETFDADSGLLHLAHQCWNTLARLELLLRRKKC